jgi:hypothetical protein
MIGDKEGGKKERRFSRY